MTDTRLVCRVCDGVFSEHEVRLETPEPETDEMRCPNCGSPQMEPYAFDPNAPTEDPLARPQAEEEA